MKSADPRVLERMIRVRGYEVDAGARLPAVALLRYMELMRWDALALQNLATGPSGMFTGGRGMVVVAQQLAIERDVGMGTALSARLWLGRVGTSSIELRHDFVDHETERRVASGATVAVNLLDGRPHAVPDTVHSFVRDEVVPACEVPPPRQSFTEAAVFCRAITVQPSELDLQDHVNHAVYLNLIEDTRIAGLAAAAPSAVVSEGQLSGRAALHRRPRRIALAHRSQLRLFDQAEARLYHTKEHPDVYECAIVKGAAESPACTGRIEL